MKNLLIVGAGGFGREVLTWVLDHSRNDIDWRFGGFLDNRSNVLEGFASDPAQLPNAVPFTPELQARYRRNLQVLGDPLSYVPDNKDIFICALGDPEQRRKYASPLLEKGAHFIVLVHPLASVSTHVSLGRGSIIGPFASVSPDVRIGEFVTVNSYTAIAHDVTIGEWSEIDGHCLVAGRSHIGTMVRVHGGAIITPDVEIGDGAVVGAGSVVIGKVPAGVTVFGNPARKFEWRETPPASA